MLYRTRRTLKILAAAYLLGVVLAWIGTYALAAVFAPTPRVAPQPSPVAFTRSI